jgi:hypothetical protein
MPSRGKSKNTRNELDDLELAAIERPVLPRRCGGVAGANGCGSNAPGYQN